MSGLVKLQLEQKVLYKLRPKYKEYLSQHLSEGYAIVNESLFMTTLQKAKLIPTNKKKFHIELDGLIDVDDKAQDKLEKLLWALYDTCKSFESAGIEFQKISTPGVKCDECNSK